MSLLLNPRVWIALALAGLLAFSHFTAYRKGKANVRMEWTASIAEANDEARRLERARQRRADESAQAAATREARIRADAARATDAVRGLRGDIESLQRASSDSLTAANNATRVLGDVLQSCTAEYQRVAEDADRATSEALSLRQAWPQ